MTQKFKVGDFVTCIDAKSSELIQHMTYQVANTGFGHDQYWVQVRIGNGLSLHRYETRFVLHHAAPVMEDGAAEYEEIMQAQDIMEQT